jgi:hypothetical protein
MILQLHNPHPFSFIVLSNELQTRLMKPVDILRINFIAMSLSPVDYLDFAIKLTKPRLFRAYLENRRSQT